ncbi:serine hydrolase domain-containing protein [Aquimarina sp. AU474]|uniref:serine hydrolase domain-containing protein n=1 Tax=Aquimarina sp. AU474 TaxID=2108529 RepID=UPI000D690D6C|nr:serine hydrolase domain-containing protein [Aquimarina sp. AU474]
MTKYILVFISVIFIGCKEKSKAPAIVKKALNPITYSMDNNANLILENPEINSIAIGVYKDGKTYAKYYGEIDKGKSNSPNDNSLFEIASVTKTFTGILVAHAVLDGKLDVEDDIRKYLDGTFDNLEYKNRPIQIRDLLTHTSGITRDFSSTLSNMFLMTASEQDKKEIRNYNRNKFIKDLKGYKLDTIPGKKYDYSPIVGPEILALILEKVYDKTYDELLQQFIFQKAHMNNSSIHIKTEDKKVTNGYSDEGKLIEPLPVPIIGAGYGLKSTIPDLLKYITYLLESDDPVIKEMKTSLFLDEEEGDQYGYFWQLSDDDFMHNGGTNGSTNWVIVMPKYNTGFTVMFNSNGKTSGKLINRIANYIYNDLEDYPRMNPYFLVRKAILNDLEKGIETYKKLKKENKNEYDFGNESMLNRIGYELLSEDRVLEAIRVFELLVSEFPNSSNPYDSLGEGYLVNEQYDLALQNYNKSFELNSNNKNAQKMIEKIKQIKSD